MQNFITNQLHDPLEEKISMLPPLRSNLAAAWDRFGDGLQETEEAAHVNGTFNISPPTLKIITGPLHLLVETASYHLRVEC